MAEVRRPRFRCPICGDPAPFIFWIEDFKPEQCPEGDYVKNVTQCQQQMAVARQAAELRKFCPEAFDRDGRMLSRGWEMIFDKHKKMQPATPAKAAPEAKGMGR